MQRPFNGPGRKTLPQWKVLTQQTAKPISKKVDVVKKPKAAKRKFRVILPELTAKQNAIDKYTFQCYTRSEARAEFKARFNKPVPVGTQFKEMK